MRSVAAVLCGLIAVPAVFFFTAAGASAAGPRIDRGEAAVVHALNRVRSRHHLPRLRASHALAHAADLHSTEMLRGHYFAHGAFNQRVRRFVRSRAIGETLAWLTPRCGRAGRVVRMWMNSPPHRAVLLSGRYRKVGIGRRAGRMGGARTCLVTADFASRR